MDEWSERECALQALYQGAQGFNSGCLWCESVNSAMCKCMIKATDVFMKLHLGFKP